MAGINPVPTRAMSEHKFHIEYATTGRAGCKYSNCKKKIVKGALRVAREVPNPFDPDGSDTTLKWYHPTCFFVAQLRVRKGTRKLSSTEDFEGDTSGIDSEDIRLVQRLIDGETLWTTTDVDEFRSMKDTPDKLGDDDGEHQVTGKKRTKAPVEEDTKRRRGRSGKTVVEAEEESDVLEAVSLVLTGKVPGHTAAAFGKLVTANGGQVLKSMSKKCEVLVCGDRGVGTGKYNKALDYEIPVVTPEWVLHSIRDGEKKELDAYRIDVESEDDQEEDEDSKEQDTEETDGPVLEGLVMALTGKVDGMTRDEFESKVEAEGGSLSYTVTRKCSLLLCGHNGRGTSKFQKAQKQGLPILMPEWALHSILAGKQLDKSEYKYVFGQAPPAAPTPVAKQQQQDDPQEEETAETPEPMEDDDEAEEEPFELPSPASTRVSTVTKRSKGKTAPVDEDMPNADQYTVVRDDAGVVWHAMTNQTNISNNNNKYYLLQLLKHNSGAYWTFFKWGRVGKVNGSNPKKHGSFEAAKAFFCKQFQSKTKNSFPVSFADFVPHPKKYTLLPQKFGADSDVESEDEEEEENKVVKGPCTLSANVQDFIGRIFDTAALDNTLRELSYDSSKLPLGLLHSEVLDEALEALTDLEKAIDKKKARSTIERLSSRFYTLIPHDFGMARLPLIDTKETVKAKVEMIEELRDMKITTTLLKKDKKKEDTRHDLDILADKLQCGLRALDSSIEEDKTLLELVEEYVRNTHGETHTWKMKVKYVLEVQRDGESNRFKKRCEDAPSLKENRMMLWHGSRMTNWVGILKEGLRIAPPSAPVTGYMFGKGVYLADAASKSSQYTHWHLSENTGAMLLCETALGKLDTRGHADSRLPRTLKGDSCFGQGMRTPDPSQETTVRDGVRVPRGKLIDSEVEDTSLRYNEYIVYDVAQVAMRYLVVFEFDYSD
ncbi:MAG: hypothetical protein MHM6MM_000498 [Cercozoa sp. M6MM]